MPVSHPAMQTNNQHYATRSEAEVILEPSEKEGGQSWKIWAHPKHVVVLSYLQCALILKSK